MTAGISKELDNVKLYYFNYNRTGGLGESIKLLLEDFEIKHKYIQVERNPEAWDNSFREELIASDKPFDCLPLLETKDGKRYFCSGPILRFLAKKLGMFDGLSDEDIQFLDATENLNFDWYISLALHVARPIVTDENRKNYIESGYRKHAVRLDRLYGIHDGPYILGSKVCVIFYLSFYRVSGNNTGGYDISYTDYVVYHTLDDHRPILDIKDFPKLSKLVEAFEKRPNIKKYLASLPHKNGPLEQELSQK
ncbi:hypothetical protein INT45_000362 [Circinella minor]|uniref:GST N-terminal domain-containing protein n=1 Tax=Circinella minor TaxID=1195481 RepID=A0A8H7RXY3_9FUNG|nr:hypothetical protein INT45_000362 [Circinella minor]